MYNLLEASLAEWGELVKHDFQAFIKDWKNKPAFEEKFSSDGQQIMWEYSSDNEILGYVSHGTRVRYATMTPDFKAKTVVDGRIPSKPGRGGVAFISRKRPRPGIKARNIDARILRKNKNKLKKIVERKVTEWRDR